MTFSNDIFPARGRRRKQHKKSISPKMPCTGLRRLNPIGKDSSYVIWAVLQWKKWRLLIVSCFFSQMFFAKTPFEKLENFRQNIKWNFCYSVDLLAFPDYTSNMRCEEEEKIPVTGEKNIFQCFFSHFFVRRKVVCCSKFGVWSTTSSRAYQQKKLTLAK